MKTALAEAGIHPISKEEYLKECSRGLEIMAVSTCGSGNLVKIEDGDVLMVSMFRPGEEEPRVSYARIGNDYLFTRGWPWVATPLNA